MARRITFTLAVIGAVTIGTIMAACETILHWGWR
jgi:hypothetical protein